MKECIVKYSTRHQTIEFRCWVRELATILRNMVELANQGFKFSNVTIKSV